MEPLSSFVRRNPNLLEPLILCDTDVVIHQNSLHKWLASCTGDGRIPNDQDAFDSDVLGFNMILLAKRAMYFFDTLEKFNVRPILVQAGMSSYGRLIEDQDTTALRYAEQVTDIMRAKVPYRIFIQPPVGDMVVREVIRNGRDIEVHQSWNDDLEVMVRLANDQNCPIIANEARLYDANISTGIIPIETVRFTATSASDEHNDLTIRELDMKSFTIDQIICKLYKRDNIDRFLPDFCIDNWDLVKVMMRAHEKPEYSKVLRVMREHTSDIADLRKRFECHTDDRTDEVVDSLCMLYGRTIQENIETIQAIDDEDEWAAREVLSYRFDVHPADADEFRKHIFESRWKSKQQVFEWLRDASIKSVLPTLCFDVVRRGDVVLNAYAFDPDIANLGKIQMRCVLAASLISRSRIQQHKLWRAILDRTHVNGRYQETDYTQIEIDLKFKGKLMDDMLAMTTGKRLMILLRTFHCDDMRLPFQNSTQTQSDLKTVIQVIDIAMNYIDRETASDEHKLLPEFKQSVIAVAQYYKSGEANEHLDELSGRHFEPNARVCHHISQLQLALFWWNSINALVGSVVAHINLNDWLDCPLIHNLTCEKIK